MVSFKKVLLLLSSSAFMANMAGFTLNRFCVSGYNINSPESKDSALTDSDFDLVSTDYSSDEDTKFERGATTSSFKPETPKPDSSASESEKSQKPEVSISRTVYVPKKTVTKIVKPFGRSFVETEVLGKRARSFAVENDSESPKMPRVTTMPEVEEDTFGKSDSRSYLEIPRPAPIPLPPKSSKQGSSTSLDKILSSDTKSVPTYVSFGRPTEDDVVPDYDGHSLEIHPDVSSVYKSAASYDGESYATPYEPKESKTKFQKFKSGTKKRMSEVSKKISEGISRTKNEILKHEKEDKSKDKSKSASKVIEEVSDEEKYDITSMPLGKDETKSKTLKDLTKSKFKDVKDSAKEAASFTSKKLHDAAHKTKKRTVSAGKKVKETTSDITSEIKEQATKMKEKLRGVVPKTKIQMDKIQTSLRDSNLKPKTTFKKLFKRKSGSEEFDEVTHL